MNDDYCQKYADLLVKYCINLKRNETLLIKTSTAASALLPHLYSLILNLEASVEFDLQFPDQLSTYYSNVSDNQLSKLPFLEKERFSKADALLYINAPIDRTNSIINISEKKSSRAKAFESIQKLKMKRSISNEFRWTICNYPTSLLSKSSKMSLKDYTKFLQTACYLNFPNPSEKWLELRAKQDQYTKYLNTISTLHFKNHNIDLRVGVKNRVWVNSDGRRNMPSGEIFTSPIETQINGSIYFSYPSRYFNKHISGVTLEFKDGIVVNYNAKRGKTLFIL